MKEKEGTSFRYRFKILDEMNNSSDEGDVKRKIGRDFEKLIQDILDSENILIKRGYHTRYGKAEQIDGVLEVYNRIILLEVKWVNENIAASSLFSFIGKIENKFEGTIGVFVSRNKLSKNFIQSMRKGRRQTVVVIDGECLEKLIYKELSFKRYIKEAIRYLSYEDDTTYPISMFINMIELERASDSDKEIFLKANNFIQEHIYINEDLVFNAQKINDEIKIKIEENFLAQTDQVKNKIYQIIVDEYNANIWERPTSLSGGNYRYSYLYLQTASFLFEKFTPNDVLLNDFALDFFGNKLVDELALCANSFIVKYVCKCYVSLDQVIKKKFEKSITKQISENHDYYFENSVTYLLEYLWGKLSSDTMTKIKKFYIGILISDRSEKFKQKKFSIALIGKSQITVDEVFFFIEDRFRKYQAINDSTNFNIYEYDGFLKYIEISKEDWYGKIRQIINKLSQK